MSHDFSQPIRIGSETQRFRDSCATLWRPSLHRTLKRMLHIQPNWGMNPSEIHYIFSYLDCIIFSLLNQHLDRGARIYIPFILGESPGKAVPSLASTCGKLHAITRLGGKGIISLSYQNIQRILQHGKNLLILYALASLLSQTKRLA